MKNLSLFKQIVTWGFIGSSALFAPLSIQDLSVEEVINPRRDNGSWVIDMANILSNKTETKSNQMITDLEQADGTEIAVVTVSETIPINQTKANLSVIKSSSFGVILFICMLVLFIFLMINNDDDSDDDSGGGGRKSPSIYPGSVGGIGGGGCGGGCGGGGC